MVDGERNNYVREKTCNAIVTGNKMEHENMKKDIEKLDSRIWWIVGSAVLTFLMTAVQLYIMLKP